MNKKFLTEFDSNHLEGLTTNLYPRQPTFRVFGLATCNWFGSTLRNQAWKHVVLLRRFVEYIFYKKPDQIRQKRKGAAARVFCRHFIGFHVDEVPFLSDKLWIAIISSVGSNVFFPHTVLAFIWKRERLDVWWTFSLPAANFDEWGPLWESDFRYFFLSEHFNDVTT